MYKIVYAATDYLDKAIKEVEREVESLKKLGWTEQGGVSICQFEYTYSSGYSVAQAMKK